MKKVTALAVFARMAETDNKALQLAPLGNIERARKVKAGTQITIGFAGDVVTGIAMGEYVGGLFLVDKHEFRRVKAEMEEEPGVDA